MSYTGNIAVKYQTPFLNITDRVSATTGGQDGLTGFAFDPRYTDPAFRWIYTYYASNDPNHQGQTRVERFWVPIDTPLRADKDTGEIIWQNEDADGGGYGTVHVAGQIHFSPATAKLYIGVGDHAEPTASANDKLVAQDLTNFWGKMLRLTSEGDVPSNNPLVGMLGVKEEIWAYGLRNPYGFSFDSMTGDLWIGDVGQMLEEEINFEPKTTAPFTAVNYGWPCREGDGAGPVNTGACAASPVTEDPFVTYPRIAPTAVLGGYVYRGTAIDWDSNQNGSVDGLELRYFYGDHIQNKVFSVSPNDLSDPPGVTDHTIDLGMPALFFDPDSPVNLYGFGRDSAGELYLIKVVDQDKVGTIYQIREE